MIKLELLNILFDLRLTLTFKSGQPHLKSCICPYGIRGQNICFRTFVKMALIKNKDIYIFAHLTAILYLRKLGNLPMERCGQKINELQKTF